MHWPYILWTILGRGTYAHYIFKGGNKRKNWKKIGHIDGWLNLNFVFTQLEPMLLYTKKVWHFFSQPITNDWPILFQFCLLRPPLKVWWSWFPLQKKADILYWKWIFNYMPIATGKTSRKSNFSIRGACSPVRKHFRMFYFRVDTPWNGT